MMTDGKDRMAVEDPRTGAIEATLVAGFGTLALQNMAEIGGLELVGTTMMVIYRCLETPP